MYKPFPNGTSVDRIVYVCEGPKNHDRGENNLGVLPKRIKANINRITDDEARLIVQENSTVGKRTDQFGRTLKKCDRRPGNLYYKRGEMAYKRYCEVLLEKVTALQKERGINQNHVIFTPWDEL